MDIASFSPAILKELIILAEKKQSLISEIEKIDDAIRATLSGKPKVLKDQRLSKVKGLSRQSTTTRKSRAKWGSMKDSIFAILKEAGSNGSTVREISAKLNMKPQNIHAWFHGTGKKMNSIKKVGEARFALVEEKAQAV